MAAPRNPLVRDLLHLADGLARQQVGPASLRQAALRRAVSTAYHALFHALCTVCSDGLVRWSRTDLVDRTYRALDHGAARRKLTTLAMMAGPGAAMQRISGSFNRLQDRRIEADHERPRVLFSRSAALILIDDAREAVELLVAKSRWAALPEPCRTPIAARRNDLESSA